MDLLSEMKKYNPYYYFNNYYRNFCEMDIYNKKKALEKLNNYLVKAKNWLENSNKNKALNGTRNEKDEWTEKMNTSIRECTLFYESDDGFRKLLQSVGNNTDSAAREGLEFARFENEISKVYKSLQRKITNLKCAITCMEHLEKDEEISLFLKNPKFDMNNQGREIKKFTIVEVNETNVIGSHNESTTQNEQITETITFDENLYISTYKSEHSL